jgi:aldo/keto reductase
MPELLEEDVMENRPFSALGREISVIGTGTWELGIDRYEIDPDEATRTLQAACETGVTFIDTADVYGDGRSERFVGRFLAAHPNAGLTVATKMGRGLPPTALTWSRDNFLSWNDRSRQNLGVETIDLVQLHSPPSEVIEAPRVWEQLDDLVARKRIRSYGVSAETCEQALEAIRHSGCGSVQLIVNVFRHKPLEEVLPAAQETDTAVIARVPLPEGILSRNHRRDAEAVLPDSVAALDAGWIFSVVPEDVGAQAAREFARVCRELVAEHVHPVQVALRWLLDQKGITCVLPESRNPHQVRLNAQAAALPPLNEDVHAAVTDIYDRLIRAHAHDHW